MDKWSSQNPCKGKRHSYANSVLQLTLSNPTQAWISSQCVKNQQKNPQKLHSVNFLINARALILTRILNCVLIRWFLNLNFRAQISKWLRRSSLRSLAIFVKWDFWVIFKHCVRIFLHPNLKMTQALKTLGWCDAFL